MSLSSGVLLVSWLLDMAEEMVVLEQISVMMPLHREFVGRVICSLVVTSLLPTHRRLLCVPDVCLEGCLWHVVVITVNSLLPTHRRLFRVPDVCNILQRLQGASYNGPVSYNLLDVHEILYPRAR
jgi:hypothetical protein